MYSRSIEVLVVFLVSRLWTAAFVYYGHLQRPFLSPVPGGWEGVANWWLNPWTTYDSQWFISIAANGYQEQTTAFFPLYPMLLKLAGPSEPAMALLGSVISNIAFLVALLLLYQLTLIDFTERTAKITVWVVAFFPTSAFFSAVYTESLFLLMIVGTFYCARRGKWGWAGCFGLLAALTRNPGAIISLALLLEYLRATGFALRQVKVRSLLAVSLPAIGFIGVQGYYWLRFGGIFSGLSSQEYYYRAPGWPWEAVLKDIIDFVFLKAFDLTTFLNVFVALMVFLLIIQYRKAIPVSYSVFTLSIILMHLSYPRIIPPYTIGAVRYMSTTFPFVQLLGHSVARISANRVLAVALFVSYLFVNAATSYLFGMKSFLG